MVVQGDQHTVVAVVPRKMGWPARGVGALDAYARARRSKERGVLVGRVGHAVASRSSLVLPARVLVLRWRGRGTRVPRRQMVAWAAVGHIGGILSSGIRGSNGVVIVASGLEPTGSRGEQEAFVSGSARHPVDSSYRSTTHRTPHTTRSCVPRG